MGAGRAPRRCPRGAGGRRVGRGARAGAAWGGGRASSWEDAPPRAAPWEDDLASPHQARGPHGVMSGDKHVLIGPTLQYVRCLAFGLK